MFYDTLEFILNSYKFGLSWYIYNRKVYFKNRMPGPSRITKCKTKFNTKGYFKLKVESKHHRINELCHSSIQLYDFILNEILRKTTIMFSGF